MRTSGPLAAILYLLAAALWAQDPFGTTDPFESRFKAKSNFQIKFKVPEKGGEVKLSTKQPVHYEKDVYWEGSEDVEIEYQDVKIRADKGRYDFATKTATLEGNVIIDQGPTRMAGSRGTFQLEEKTAGWKTRAPTWPHVSHHCGWIEKIAEATYRVHHGIFTACDVPDQRSLSLGSDGDAGRLRAHEGCLVSGSARCRCFTRPTSSGRPRRTALPGFLVRRRLQRAARGVPGLTYYRVTGRSVT